ncbi:MAG: hypothetical protein WBD46_09225 [Acidobacteriaceae bacterium]
MLRERLFPGLPAAGSERTRASHRRWQWIFPVLIVVGLILVLASLLFLIGGQGGGAFPAA